MIRKFKRFPFAWKLPKIFRRIKKVIDDPDFRGFGDNYIPGSGLQNGNGYGAQASSHDYGDGEPDFSLGWEGSYDVGCGVGFGISNGYGFKEGDGIDYDSSRSPKIYELYTRNRK